MYWKLFFDAIDNSYKQIKCSIVESLRCYWYSPGQYFCIVYNFKNLALKVKIKTVIQKHVNFLYVILNNL